MALSIIPVYGKKCEIGKSQVGKQKPQRNPPPSNHQS